MSMFLKRCLAPLEGNEVHRAQQIALRESTDGGYSKEARRLFSLELADWHLPDTRARLMGRVRHG